MGIEIDGLPWQGEPWSPSIMAAADDSLSRACVLLVESRLESEVGVHEWLSLGSAFSAVADDAYREYAEAIAALGYRVGGSARTDLPWLHEEVERRCGPRVARRLGSERVLERIKWDSHHRYLDRWCERVRRIRSNGI